MQKNGLKNLSILNNSFILETIFESEIVTYKLDNGIVFTTINSENMDYEQVDFAIKKKIEFVEGKVYPMISDIRKVKYTSRTAKKRMAEPDAAYGINSVAVIVRTKVQRVICSFFISYYGKPCPTKVFTNEKSALKWSKQFINENQQGNS